MKSMLNTGIFWYWNGDPSKAGIRRQLKEMADAGFQCVYLHPMPARFRPHMYFEGMKIPYLGERYFEFARVMLEECQRLDLAMMLYDEGGWPSGSALGMVMEDPSCCARFLVRTAAGTYVEETRHFPDLLDPRVTRRFIELTHERYRAAFGDEFGRTIRGIFTDEPYYCFGVGSEAVRIVPDWQKRFRREYGPDLNSELLYGLFSGCGGKPGAAQVRRLYTLFLSKLFAKNYCAVVAQWCRKNHLDFEGHFDKEESVFESGFCGDIYEYLTHLDVPGVDAIWRFIHPATVTGRVHYPVLASSAAIRRNRKQALAECFNVYGYDLAPESMNFVANALFVQGINRILPMPYLYCDQGAHKVSCSTDLSSRVPQWKAMKALNEAWRQAGQFDAGALKPRVWVYLHNELTVPDNPYVPPQEILAAGDRADALFAKLDRAAIFWRFANLNDLKNQPLPDVLIYPSQPEERELAQIGKLLKGKKVKVVSGWQEALAKYGEIDLMEKTTSCMVRPCLRPEGHALMVFNPTAKPTILRFRASAAWRDVTPDVALAALRPLTVKNGVAAVPVPPGALRILLKDADSEAPVKFASQELNLAWQVTEIARMEMHALPATRTVTKKVNTPLPPDGVWKDPDFSGTLTLQTEVTLDRPVEGYLEFDHIGCSAILSVNREKAVSRAFGPWAYPVKLKAGVNTLTLRVSTTAGREWKRCFRDEMVPHDWYNSYQKMIVSFSDENPRPGVSPAATLWEKLKQR